MWAPFSVASLPCGHASLWGPEQMGMVGPGGQGHAGTLRAKGKAAR